jgi:hypothetical protein
MKISIKAIVLSIASLIFFGNGALKSQSMTGSIINPCNNNGQINVTVTGLTPPISYTYTNWAAGPPVVHANINSTSNNLTGIGAYQGPWGGNANIWTVMASDGTNAAGQTFTLQSPFVADSIKVLPAMCPAVSSVQVTSFTGGTSPFSCLWTNINTTLPYTGNPAPVPNGQYTFVITDGAGCKISSWSYTSNINVYSLSTITVNITGTAANCTNGTANAVVSGGTSPYSYLWNNSAVSQSLSGLSAGFYSCLVSDALGCQSTGYYQLPQAVNISFNTSITNATCLQTNGSILSFVSGGTAPYTFLWSNSATTQNLTGLAGGQNYGVQITDANGCLRNTSVYVGVTTPISVTYSASPSSCTLATGSATVTPAGGQTPYSILWYTFPSNSTGASISNKTSGIYSFKVTDANGCIQTGSTFIPPGSTITAGISSNAVPCPSNAGNLSVQASGTNPPFTYLWNISSTSNVLTNVPLGNYSCVITDAAGCSVTKFGYLTQNTPINVGLNSTQASCIFASNGVVIANATGGTAPYTYLWSNNQSGPTATGLTTGNYYVWVTDANGCKNSYLNSMAYVGYNANNTSCYCTITGTVYTDLNNDCVRNPGENGIPNVQIHCSGYGYTYTNANGVYSLRVPTGSYVITETIQQLYPLATCQSNNQPVTVTAAPNCQSIVNFANNTVILHDLHIITTNLNWPVPGNQYSQRVIVQNDGSAVESTVKLGYKHDGQLSYGNCTPWALTQQNAISYPTWYSITSGFPVLNPGGSSFSTINYNVPTNIPLNTIVTFYDSTARQAPIATSWLTDNTPWNNVDYHQAQVLASYDPNFKEVSPTGTGPQGNIEGKDSLLTYIVHFQNTGSYYAQNVVVVDTLDSDLAITSMRPGYSDHKYSVTMSDNGVIKFEFANINLPWQSAYGDALSSGMFVYTVKLKSNLAVGTQIKNKAAIYFDFNEPIITNTTLNTLSKPVSVSELQINSDNTVLYPNPANTYFTLNLSSPENTKALMNVFDISGREISGKNIDLRAGENSITENTEHFQSGIYFVQIKSGNAVVQKKLIITK